MKFSIDKAECEKCLCAKILPINSIEYVCLIIVANNHKTVDFVKILRFAATCLQSGKNIIYVDKSRHLINVMDGFYFSILCVLIISLN